MAAKDKTAPIDATGTEADGPGTATAAVEALEAEAQAAASDGEVEVEGPFILVREQKFHVAPEVPAIVVLKMAAAGDSRTSQPKQMSAMLTYIEHVIVPEDREEFLQLLEDAQPMVDFDEINDILNDCTEALAGRPTEP